MLKAGYGDIIGKFSALNDWKLSHLINNEYFCPYIYDLTYAQIQKTLSLADGILNRNEESIKALMEALIIIGILMSFAGSSRPASGSEHHLSHYFEITGILDGTPYFSHGIDVAYSTIITAKLREKICASPFPDQVYRISPDAYHAIMSKIYKSAAAGCIALQEKTQNYTTDRAYLQKQDSIRAILAEMPTADEITQMLSLVNLDIADFHRLYGKEKIKNAILYAKDLKDRYTVLWVNYDLFGEIENV
jgi:glycerol-1-phosphate dehydrogenase [NAD(P)+]